MVKMGKMTGNSNYGELGRMGGLGKMGGNPNLRYSPGGTADGGVWGVGVGVLK